MLIVVEDEDGQRLLDVVVEPGATVEDLASVAGLDPERLSIDGVPTSRDHDLTGLLYRGSVVRRAEATLAGTAERSHDLRLEQIAGADVGWWAPLPMGPSVLGRSPDAELSVDDPSLSGRHCRFVRGHGFEVELSDLGSRNGTRVAGSSIETVTVRPGDVIWAGDGVYRLRSGAPAQPYLTDADAASGTVVFNRPPRERASVEVSTAELPPPVAPRSSPATPFSVAAILSPLVMAAAMVALLGSLRFALFALLSPVIALGTWIEGRVRARRDDTRIEQERRARVAAFSGEVERSANAERERRWRLHPDPGDLLSWIETPSPRLWERRAGDPDATTVVIGVGDSPWCARDRAVQLDPGDADLAQISEVTLVDAPVVVGIGPGEVLGIVGDEDQARAAARSMLLSLAATTGPSDLRLAVVAPRDHLREWGWAAWLPHCAGDHRSGMRPMVFDHDETTAISGLSVGELAAGGRGGGIVVVDSGWAVAGRSNPVRRLWSRGGEWGGIVLARRDDQLPAECTTVLRLDSPGSRGSLWWPRSGDHLPDVHVAHVALRRAVVAARTLARFEDPDAPSSDEGLPAHVSLVELLAGRADPHHLSARWGAGGALGSPGELQAVLGVDGEGTFGLDLVRDGPHALVAGTTGSGKSELLRTLIASLALEHSPLELNLVLIDYKGGSAFDSVAGYPHVVGLVTDLDDRLAGRALTCLEAELRHREQLMRAAGASDIADLEPGAMPRLVVVIDEFAALVADLPGFVDALVSVAQRGRSLGMHLVLATQRPAGVVNENITANTNVRIALRVQDGTESFDVVGVADAASLPRHVPGRCVVRLGDGERRVVQVASVSAPAPARGGERVRLAGAVPGTGPTGMALVGEALRVAAGSSVFDLRVPWPDPLPAVLDSDDVASAVVADSDDELFVGVADRPERQRRERFGWDPDRGNLLIVGRSGSGPEDALAAIGAAATSSRAADRLHVYVISGLASAQLQDTLDGAAHVGGFVGAGDRELLAQLVDRLRRELDTRTATGSSGPDVLVLIDHLGGVLDDIDTAEEFALVDNLRRVWTDGPSVGIHMAVAADRPGAVPNVWSSSASTKWFFELADASEYQLAGIGREHIPPRQRGRGVDVDSTEFQVLPRFLLPQPLETDPALAGPIPLRDTSEGVAISELPPLDWGEPPWLLPAGLSPTTLDPVSLPVHPGDGVLVAGPPRSGVTSLLRAWVRSMVGAAGDRQVLVLGHGFGEGEEAFATPTEIVDAVDEVARSGRTCVVVIDDAHRVHDKHRVHDNDRVNEDLGSLVGRPGVDLVIIGGRVADLRGGFGHWTAAIRRSRIGVLITPDADLDGDLLGVRLARGSTRRHVPGRGVVVHDGIVEPVQIAHHGADRRH